MGPNGRLSYSFVDVVVIATSGLAGLTTMSAESIDDWDVGRQNGSLNYSVLEQRLNRDGRLAL